MGAVRFKMSEDKIYKLKSLIRDYEELKEELSTMIDLWNNHDDPMSDPGLQYEKECEVDKAYKAITEFAKNGM